MGIFNYGILSRSGFTGLLLILLLQVWGCKPDNPDDSLDYNRAEMLSNVGQNLIVPDYRSLKTAVSDLDSAIAKFGAAPDLVGLQDAQDAWKSAALAWQKCSPYEFGPAMNEALRASVNTFPTDTAQIHTNISTAPGTNLELASNLDAKGFPALDYLLFGLGADNAAILAQYSGAGDAAQHRAYLQEVTTDLKSRIDRVVNAWEPSGNNYLATFSSDDGTSVGSNTGSLVNQLNFDWELIKNPKIGIPLGKKTLGQILPEKVEAYYSGISAELAAANAKSIRQLFLGGNGMGLGDNLDQVEAQYNGSNLSAAITAQLDQAIAALEAIPDPLSATIQNNPSVVETAYVEIQKAIVLLKTDMPSALGILITYQDNDGD